MVFIQLIGFAAVVILVRVLVWLVQLASIDPREEQWWELERESGGSQIEETSTSPLSPRVERRTARRSQNSTPRSSQRQKTPTGRYPRSEWDTSHNENESDEESN